MDIEKLTGPGGAFELREEDVLGRPNLGVQLEIRDAEDEPVPEGVEGEVCVRSAYNMIGYWRDPETTDRTS